MAMADLQQYSQKLCLIKYELDIDVFVLFNYLFFFAISLRKWQAHFLLMRSNGEIHEKKHFTESEKDFIFD